MERITSLSVENTIEIGQKIGHIVIERWPQQAVLILLNGSLGAGKTHLVKGLALSWQISDLIKSPTYTLAHEYALPIDHHRYFVHIDGWRLTDPASWQKIDWQQHWLHQDWLAVEWPPAVNVWPTTFPPFPLITVNLEYGDKVNERHISWTMPGE